MICDYNPAVYAFELIVRIIVRTVNRVILEDQLWPLASDGQWLRRLLFLQIQMWFSFVIRRTNGRESAADLEMMFGRPSALMIRGQTWETIRHINGYNSYSVWESERLMVLLCQMFVMSHICEVLNVCNVCHIRQLSHNRSSFAALNSLILWSLNESLFAFRI